MIRNAVKQLTPPLFYNYLRYFFTSKFKGNYSNWQAAKMHSLGYDKNNILEKVTEASLKVANGEAVYERDSVLFDEVHYSWPLLASLMFVLSKEKGSLQLIDFGGALGSSYFQNKKFLQDFENISWNVVEQEQFVKLGREKIKVDNLNFYYSIEECVKNHGINTVLLSSVINYLENPFDVVEQLVQLKVKYIIFDRTFFIKNNRKDTITVQKVPAFIYKASYPCWLLNEEQFKKKFQAYNYSILEEFEAIDGESRRFYSKGFLFQLNN